MDNRKPVITKTIKSQFDIEYDNAIKAMKHVKGVSFVLRKGNNIEYVNIPNTAPQTFRYFPENNTSHLTNEERQAIYKKKTEIRILTSKSIPVKEELTEEYLP